MRYRLMATYRGVPYEAGLGPTDADVVLFAACPPPENLDFEPATGHWRKPVPRAEVALWESRPTGIFCGDPCLVLDDLGERLHIAYLGDDPYRAARHGYHEVEPAVFEVVTAREAVTGLTEERVPHTLTPWQPDPPSEQAGYLPQASPIAEQPVAEQALGEQPAGDLDTRPATGESGSQPVAAPVEPPPALSARSRRGRAAARSPRAKTPWIFSELMDLAAIPRTAYAIDEQVDGAICLISTEHGFEVFTASAGSRNEMRLFNDEEAAYFYLFGLLAAEAVRDGRLVPPAS